jgi:uracil phosphoribosyltransferase
VGVVAAQEGFDRLASEIPADNITVAAIDPILNEKKYIVPGLGDYGDRYFGT